MAEIISLFEQIETGLKGFWEDSLSLDKRLIERKICPKCKKRNLVYRGFSCPTAYKAFGICEPCEFAELFWTEPVTFVKAKKSFSS